MMVSVMVWMMVSSYPQTPTPILSALPKYYWIPSGMPAIDNADCIVGGLPAALV